jgi:thiamine-monophosphate kinase
VRAAIDVSDGLSLDLSRICQESGCGAVIDPAAIPVAAAASELVSRGDDKTTALAHALGDGEDFELILAVAPAEADRLLRRQPLDVPLTRIGQFVEKTGLWTLAKGGRQVPLVPRGYEHRFDA